MRGALKDSLQSLKAWVFQSPSRIQKLAEGTGPMGTRAAPTQTGTNDKKIGSRLDFGEDIVKDGKEYKRYKLQINKGADNKTLRQLADKDSHKVWSTADIPVGEGSMEDAVDKLFEDLEAGEDDA